MHLRLKTGTLSILLGLAVTLAAQSQHLQYPQARRDQVTEVVRGAVVADPYRWLEDTESIEAKKWLGDQEALLAAQLHNNNSRDATKKRLLQLLDYDLFGLPMKGGSRLFYTKSAAGGAATELWMEGSGEPRQLIDLESVFGKSARLGAFIPTRDGLRVALLVRRQQSNWIEAQVLDVDSGKLLDDSVIGIYSFASRVAWERAGNAFFYTALEGSSDSHSNATARNAQVFRHELGTRQEQDAKVEGLPVRSGWLYTQTVSDDGRWLIIGAKPGSAQHDEIYVGAIGDGSLTVGKIAGDSAAAFIYLGSDDAGLFFYTDAGAENGRVVKIPHGQSEPKAWTEIVSAQKNPISARDQTGANALGMFGGQIVLTYLRDGQPYLSFFSSSGRRIRDVSLPVAGSIWGGISGTQSESELFYSFLGLADPGSIYRLKVDGGEPLIFKAAKVPGLDRESIEVNQVFVRSGDGTRVPMFIAHRRGLKADGQRRTWIYGYGAMGWVSFLYFQPQILVWLEQGGVYAQPSIRGGGEYGKSWHDAGSGLREQNSIDDFVASTRWLIEHGYTSSKYLVGHGGSLSGGLIGAALNQQPTLFGAAIVDRPVLDLLRYDKFTGGAYWASELGATTDADAVAVLRRLSPYHNLKQQCYPATLIMSGDLDQVAVPAHAYKYTAALQHDQTCDRPVLLKVMRGAGHNFGATPASIADSYADALEFMNRNLPGSADSRNRAK